MLPYLIIAVIVAGVPALYLAIRSRELRKFLAGAFFVSGGMQFYFWQVNLTVPLFDTGAVQTPDLSFGRSMIHFVLFFLCLYFGFIRKPKDARQESNS